MKTKLLILSFISVVGTLLFLTSCKPTEPDLKEVNPKTCLKAYMLYYPYLIDENFIFVNEELTRRWEVLAYDWTKKGVYPETYMSSYDEIENEEPNENYGNWSSTIYAYMLEKGISPTLDEPSVISTYITHTKDANLGKPISIAWQITLRLSDDEIYFGNLLNSCSEEEMSSMITDTITIPMLYQRSSSLITLPKGSYALIIKRKGLTEFSVDGGQTVWKRVIE